MLSFIVLAPCLFWRGCAHAGLQPSVSPPPPTSFPLKPKTPQFQDSPSPTYPPTPVPSPASSSCLFLSLFSCFLAVLWKHGGCLVSNNTTVVRVTASTELAHCFDLSVLSDRDILDSLVFKYTCAAGRISAKFKSFVSQVVNSLNTHI